MEVRSHHAGHGVVQAGCSQKLFSSGVLHVYLKGKLAQVFIEGAMTQAYGD